MKKANWIIFGVITVFYIAAMAMPFINIFCVSMPDFFADSCGTCIIDVYNCWLEKRKGKDCGKNCECVYRNIRNYDMPCGRIFKSMVEFNF